MARWIRFVALPAMAAAVFVACGGGGATPTPASVPTAAPSVAIPSVAAPSVAAPSVAPSVAPSAVATSNPSASPLASSAPPSAVPSSISITLSGDKSVQGAWTTYATRADAICNNPTYDGPNILFFAQSSDASVVLLVTLDHSSIQVSERAGGGSTYTDREFQGTGVSPFDAAAGASFDSDLAEVTPSGDNSGTLGKITHVSGAVKCGSQTVGSSTVTATGATPDGPVSGPFSSFRVSCNNSAQYGKSVSTSAIVTAGSNPTSLILNVSANYPATLFMNGKSPATATSFTVDPTATIAVTDTGAHIDADFTQSEPANGPTPPPVRLHVAGDLTCGAFSQSP